MAVRRVLIALVVVAVGAAVAAVAGPRRIRRLLTGRLGGDVRARKRLTATAVNEAGTADVSADAATAAGVRGGDDLKIIEGIGPRLERVLHEAGITSFAGLAETSRSRLETIMREAGRRKADPTTWSEQARLAADGEWQALQDLQATLKRGRRRS